MNYKIISNGIKKIDQWEHFSWKVIINNEEFDYRTGLGNVLRLNQLKLNKGLYIIVGKYYAIIPLIDDILHCLIIDQDCADQSFESFCLDSGYDTDSRKALEIYLQCQVNGHKLRKALGSEYYNTVKRIRELDNY